jgi:hypothetical protein
MTRAKTKKATHGKQPGEKQVEVKPPKKGLPWFAWLLIALAIVGVVVFVRIYPMSRPSTDNVGMLRAAIVDQLSSFQENEGFVVNVTKELEDYGFEVDLYQGDEITVEFYRQLPTRGYKLILFRAHSGLLAEDGEVKPRTVLFTNEEYSETDYYLEQLYDQLAMGGACEGCPMMFGITPEFVSAASVVGRATDMEGRFDDTVIIMMGCGGIYLPDLAEAFVNKGASVYLAWDASVDLDYVDIATPYLIKQLCSDKVTIKEVVDSTMHIIGPDPEYEAELQYYPSGVGDTTLAELVQTVFDAGDNAGT